MTMNTQIYKGKAVKSSLLFLLSVVALLMSPTGFTQTSAKKAAKTPAQAVTAPILWGQEPDAVFGIKLGEPLAPDTPPKCPPSGRANNYQQPTELCIESDFSPYADRLATLRAVPLDTVTSTATIFFEEGNVSSFHIGTEHSNYQKLRAILVDRYGSPTSSEMGTVKARSGGEFSSETLTWRGLKNTIQLRERNDMIDKSLAVIYNNALMESAGKRIKGKLKDAASKL